jgi:hypothetical protein
MGKIPGDGQGRSHRGKAGAVGSCTKEDRRCAEGAMGEGKSGEEDGIAGWRDTVTERTKTEASRTKVPLIGALRGILEE